MSTLTDLPADVYRDLMESVEGTHESEVTLEAEGPEALFERYCNYNGLIHWSSRLREAWEAIKSVYLTRNVQYVILEYHDGDQPVYNTQGFYANYADARATLIALQEKWPQCQFNIVVDELNDGTSSLFKYLAHAPTDKLEQSVWETLATIQRLGVDLADFSTTELGLRLQQDYFFSDATLIQLAPCIDRYRVKGLK